MDNLLRQRAVTEITGISRSQIYAMMDADEFPRPYKIGRQAVAWRESEIEQWIDGLEKSTGWRV